MGRHYRCIYCSKSLDRDKLVTHMEKEHSDMLNPDKGFTANHVVFDICNNKQPVGDARGVCRICKAPTMWNEKTVRYDAFCSDRCKAVARQNAVKNMMKVYNKPTLLNDMDHQEKMLANRSISGKYRWSDGTYKTYVGNYEKKFLEFCDGVLGLDSSDLVTPGPTLKYEHNGEEHVWITDALYLPYNLVFDIKDGGDNKNTREMPEYRSKQIAKEKMITDQGEYSYIRLTNNEFVQLLDIFAELKKISMEPDPHTISRIHESLIGGALPPAGATDVNPHPYLLNYHTFAGGDEGYALCNDIASDCCLTVDDNGKIKKKNTKKLLAQKECIIYKYKGANGEQIMREAYSKYKSQKTVRMDYFAKLVSEMSDILTPDQLDYSPVLEQVSISSLGEKFTSLCVTIETAVNELVGNRTLSVPVVDPYKMEQCRHILRNYKNLVVKECVDGGYYVENTISKTRSRLIDSIDDIDKSLLDSVS